MNTITLIVGAVIIAALSSIFGYWVGKAKGVAEGWVECFLEKGRLDKSRRDKHGRFTEART